MNLGESVLFATIMTLIEEIKNEEKKVFSAEINDSFCTYDTSIDMSYDAINVKNKLCKIAQELFDKTDEVLQTTTDISANEIIPAIINGIIFETVDAINVSDENKKEVYEFALQYCAIDSDFRWELFCIDDGQLTDSLLALTDLGMDMIIIASNRGQMGENGIEFIRLLAEFMLYLEDAIIKNCSSISLHKRPPLIALEKAIAAYDKEMKRMEDDNPSLKEQNAPSEEKVKMERLLKNARSELNSDNMNGAEVYYREILKIDPNNWEAIFYSVFCSAYRTADTARASEIPKLTLKIAQCVPNAMNQAKNKLFSRMDIITELGDVAVRICNLASNYFVASMNTFKASSGGSTTNTSKVLQVSSIINMMFVVGDSIEENFGDDLEIIKNIAYPCWKIGFECYENCNMPAPPKLYDYYLKMIKYEPSFRCSKPLTDGRNLGGCYIATAVYGSYDCPQVWTLRRYRDYYLTQSWFGRTFIRFYYATSPTVVRLFKNTKWFNAVFRKFLDKFTIYLIANGYKDTPYVDKE